MTQKEGTAEQAWSVLTGDGKALNETGLFIIGSQVLAYSGFYFAYEHFLIGCCEAKSSTPIESPIGYPAIKEAITSYFGREVEEEVWSHSDVERIRRVRNDLVYKSGKPSKESLRLAEDMVIEGHLQVTPNDIKEEMEALSSRIDIMVNQGFRDCP